MRILAALIVFLALPIDIAFAQLQAEPPLFSVERGFYTESFQVDLTTNTSDAKIRYTTDGTTPSATVGILYNNPIQISATTMVRAVAYKDGLSDSAVTTHSYLFLADVVQQNNQPAGYPAEFALNDQYGPYPADYEMDPEVTEHAAYRTRMEEALGGLPVLSLVTDVANLFEPTMGIYYNARERGREWERPVSVELIYPDGRTGFQINAGLRTHGKGGRIPRISPKKSFRLYFRTEYGVGRLNFPLFDREGATQEFDKLVIRAGSNNKWHHWSKFQRPVALYVRDEFARRSQLAMGQVSPHGIHVHLYLNGLYWGIYNVVERIDDVYMSTYFGGNEFDWDVIQPNEDDIPEAAEGTSEAWNQLFDLVNTTDSIEGEMYQSILTYLDVENFIDYMILMHYIENVDWPLRNWYAARNRISNDGFKFFAWDSELGLKDKSRNILDVDADSTPARLFQRLSQNSDFRIIYADRIYKHLFNDGALTPTKTIARFTELTDIVNLSIIAESARWGDYRRDVYQRPDKGDQAPYELYTRNQHWLVQRDKMLAEYFPVRTENVLTSYREADLYPNITPPQFSQLDNQPNLLRIDNAANGQEGDIYYTLDGSDPRATGGTIATTANNGGDLKFIVLEEGTTVKARIKDGDVWSVLIAQSFSEVQDFSNLVINEIMYNPPGDGGIPGDEFEFIELFNKGTTDLNLSGLSFTQGIAYTFASGDTIGANGFLILARNLAQFQNKYGFLPADQYAGRLRNSGELVELRDDQGTLIDGLTYDDTEPWPTDPDGNGSTLELTDADLDNGMATSWQASIAAKGTPGAVNSTAINPQPCNPVPSALVITEINYNSPLTLNADDWVEIYNLTTTSVDLTGWVIQDEESSFTLPTGAMLASRSYYVLVKDETLFRAIHPTITNYTGNFLFGLSGGGERIRLLSPSGCVVDEVDYDDVEPWPLSPDGQGPTLSLVAPTADNFFAENWKASLVQGGTPGVINDVDTTPPLHYIFLPAVNSTGNR